MKFLKAKTTEGKTEFFNISAILTIQPNGSTTKILMGAGMAWRVYTDSIEIVDITEVTKQ